MNIEECRMVFAEGKIDRGDYARLMFENYEELFSYHALLKSSKVKEIVLNEEEILFKMLLCSPCNEKPYELIMKLYKQDYGAAQNTVLTFGEYEPLEFDMLSRLVNYIGEGCFFDIGANLGWYTLNAAKQCPLMKIYAFEPIAETFHKMQTNILLNHLSQIKCFNIGFYDENATVQFYYDVSESGASSMQDLRGKDETRRELCNMERLDDFVSTNNISSIDFIKCDVEGAELFVFRGGVNSIQKYKPIIFSEMLRKWSAKFGYHPNDIIDLLASMGYQCFVIKEKGKLRRIDYVDDETVETNYFFMHLQKHDRIINNLCV